MISLCPGAEIGAWSAEKDGVVRGAAARGREGRQRSPARAQGRP